jgi:hypothetical protein
MSIPGRRLFVSHAVKALLCVTVACAALAGCSNGLSESDVLSKLEASGLTIEKLNDNLLTQRQRQRIESQPETILSVRVSDAAGQTQTLTLVGFERDWQAEHAKDEGVPGFVVRNWLFVGVVTAPDIQARIEGTLL